MREARSLAVALAVCCLAGGMAGATAGPTAGAATGGASMGGPVATTGSTVGGVESAARTAGSTGVRLSLGTRIPEDPIVVGENVTARVVVTNASHGVGSYDVTVTSERTTVAEVVGVRPLGEPDRNVTTVGPSSATVSGIGADTRNGSGVVVVAVTLRTVGNGTTALSLSVDAVGDETGRAYDVTDVAGTTLDVEPTGPIPPGPPEIVPPDPPRDPDDDGLYEDVNGDGDVDFVDVIDLLFAGFEGLNDDSALRAAVDFDGDGRVGFPDVVDLLFEL
jgi:hypothetical protein